MKKLILAVTLLALSAGITMGADMIAGNPKNGANVVGEVTVERVGDTLEVTYTITNLDWIITETHLHVGTSPGDFPKWPKDPPPGQFAHSSSHDVADGIQEVTLTVQLADIFPGGIPTELPTLFIAAHAVVGTLCPCEDITPECMPDEVMVKVVHSILDIEPDYENSYFVATVGGDTCLDGEYDAWCIDTDRAISPVGTDAFGIREYRRRPVPQKADVYFSLDCASLPVVDPELVEDCDDMDLVLWILNYVAAGDVIDSDGSDCDGEVITFGDIQRAIWELLNDDTEEDGALGDWSQCRVDEIIAMAEEGFEPICTEDVGLILLPYVYVYPELHAMAGQVIKDETTANGYPDTGYDDYPGDPIYPGDPAWPVDVVGVRKYQQPILIMVPVPCCFCDETAWAGTATDVSDEWPDEDEDGYKYEFPGKNWAMFFTYPEDADVAP